MAKPSSQDVSKRLLILKYVVVQALALPPQDLLNDLFSQWSKDEQREFTNGFAERAKQIVSSLKSYKLWSLMTKEEQEFIQAIPPKVKFQQHLNAMWRLESATVLMWALGLITDFPSFDNQSDPEILKQIPHEDISKFINNARLLPDNEIERKRSLAELWHWRSRTRQLAEEKRVPPPSLGFESFEQIVQQVANEAYKQGDLSEIIGDDFSAKGKPYRDISDDEWSEVRSITMERHHALNWLYGYAKGNQWDKTPTDT
jgi:hypothetical protein